MANVSLTSPVRNTGAGNIGVVTSFDVWESGTNQATNTSTVSYSYKIDYYCPSGWTFGGTTRPKAGRIDLVIDGVIVKSIDVALQNGWGAGTKYNGSGSLTVTHNNDGSKTCKFGAYMYEGTDVNHANPPYTYAVGSNVSSISLTKLAVKKVSTIDSFTGNDLRGNFKATYTTDSGVTNKLRISIPNVKALETFNYASGTVFKLSNNTINYLISNYKDQKIKLGAVIETWYGTTKIGESTELMVDILVSEGTMFIKVNNAWKRGNVYIKVNNTWKKATGVYIKVNGTWKKAV